MPIIRFSIIAASLILTLFLAFGCDDDCATCPYDSTEPVLVEGLIRLSNDSTIFVQFSVVSTTGEPRPEVDSMTVAGRPLSLNYIVDVPNMFVRTEIYDAGFAAIDSADMVAYTPFGTDTCRLPLLDSIEYIGWRTEFPWDTVSVETGLEVFWHAVPAIDHYKVRVVHVFDGDATSSTFYQMDTSMVIPPEDNQYAGFWGFYVTAVGGRDSSGNMTAYTSGDGRVLWTLSSESPRADLRIFVDTLLVAQPAAAAETTSGTGGGR
ncbi:MAG: hypothetical protein JSW34_04605 [Candidatus Zixiibacteriota bacterium]|nr:MAG: hypothetical protein JSW34_04605 [candidate division Zixibacteria bacterium]